MNSKQIIIAVIVILVIVVGYIAISKPVTAPIDETAAPLDSASVEQTSDSPAVILNDVEIIDLGDVDLEFNAIDTDLNSL